MSLQIDIKKKLHQYTLHVQFEADKSCLGILGPSGCGKSMTLKSIAGIVTPDEGRIVLDGKVLFDSEKKINLKPQQRNIGYLFQNYALFPNMTVKDNIKAGLGSLSFDRDAKEKKVKEMIARFQLHGLEKRYPRHLSGGQQQRVALARILAYEPEVLLLDEPFSAMDAHLREGLQLELAKTLEAYGGTVLIVTHDRDEAYKLSENLMIFEQGRILIKKETKELFKHPGKQQAARLTGCKNISKAEKVSDYKIKALEWGIILQTEQLVTDTITAVGVRAHDFHGIFNSDVQKYDNVFKVRVVEQMETPFEWNIMLQHGTDGNIWWKVSKESIAAGYQPLAPDYMHVKKEDILLLE